MAELQDVLDEQGRPTGEQLPKDEIFARGLWRLVVHIWLVNDKRELLAQRRAQRKGIFDGLWDVTVGGGVKVGEEPEAAAARELGEELGIIAAPEELVYIGRYKLPKIIPETGQQMNDFSDTFMLRRDVKASDVYMDPGEVSSVRTMPLKEVIRQTAGPETAKQWVPHGPAYYAEVGQKCLDLAA